MAITYQTPGALGYDDLTSPLAVAFPTTVTAGDKLLLFIGQKPSTANSGSITTPSGFTLVGSLTGAGGYGTTLGADTGNTNIYVYEKNAAGTEGGTTVSLVHATTNVLWAQILRFTTSNGSWAATTFTTGSDIAAGNVSIAGAADPGFAAGDVAVWGMCIPSDVTTPAQFSAHAITAAGVTFGTAVETSEADSTTGNDIGGYIAYAPVSSGTSTGVPTFTATAGGTTTNVRGPGIIVRLRESVWDGVTAYSSSTTSAQAYNLTQIQVVNYSSSTSSAQTYTPKYDANKAYSNTSTSTQTYATVREAIKSYSSVTTSTQSYAPLLTLPVAYSSNTSSAVNYTLTDNTLITGWLSATQTGSSPDGGISDSTVTSDDGLYNTFTVGNGNTYNLYAFGFDPLLPSSSSVFGAEIRVTGYADTNFTGIVGIREGTTTANLVLPGGSGNEATVTVGSLNNDWGGGLNGGEANQSNFHVNLEFYNTTGATRTVNIDQIQIRFRYKDLGQYISYSASTASAVNYTTNHSAFTVYDVTGTSTQGYTPRYDAFETYASTGTGAQSYAPRYDAFEAYASTGTSTQGYTPRVDTVKGYTSTVTSTQGYTPRFNAFEAYSSSTVSSVAYATAARTNAAYASTSSSTVAYSVITDTTAISIAYSSSTISSVNYSPAFRAVINYVSSGSSSVTWTPLFSLAVNYSATGNSAQNYVPVYNANAAYISNSSSSINYSAVFDAAVAYASTNISATNYTVTAFSGSGDLADTVKVVIDWQEFVTGPQITTLTDRTETLFLVAKQSTTLTVETEQSANLTVEFEQSATVASLPNSIQ